MAKELELAIKIGGRLDKSLNAAVNSAQAQLNSIAKTSNKVMTAATLATVAAGAKLMKDSVQAYQDYESALNSAAAVAGVEKGTAQYEALNTAAREAGRTTVKTAKESANALEYMALAGWSVEDSTKALMPVLKLSAATGGDLATTSDLVTDSMANLGLGIDSLGHYLDVSAAANNKSNQTALQLQEAYLGVGGVLNNLNTPIEESAAVLGVLANRGTKGSEAGTALNAILVNMQKKSGDAAKAMAQLGVSMYDENGDARSIIDTFQEINEKTSGMTEEQRNLMYQMIGGKSHVDSFAKIMAGFNDTAADGQKEVYSLMNAFQNCDGALDKLYDIKTDTLEGSTARLNSAFDDMKISIGEKIAPYLQDMFNNLADKMPEIAQGITKALDGIMPVAGKVMNFISSHAAEILPLIPKIAAGFAAFKIGTGTIKGAESFVKLISSLGKLSKVSGGATVLKGVLSTLTGITTTAGLAAAGIGAVFVAIALLKKHQNELIKQNLAEHFGNISLSASEVATVVEGIFSKTTIRHATEIAGQFEKVDDYLTSMNDSGAAIQKYNWKASIGLELSEAEIGDYRSQVENYIQSAISAVEQQHYSLSMSLELLSDNPQLQLEMRGIIDSVYTGAEAELQALGKKMGDYVMEALSDGIITSDEAEVISAMQQKIADLTARLTNAQSQAKLDKIRLEFDFGSITSDSFKDLQGKIQEWISEKETSLKDVELQQLATVNLLTEIPQEALDAGFTGTLEEYKEKVRQEIERTFQRERFEAHIQGINISIDGITSAYETELGGASASVSNFVNDWASTLEGASDTVAKSFLNSGNTETGIYAMLSQTNLGNLNNSTKGAIRELFNGMRSEIQQAETLKSQLLKTGEEIPQSLLDGLHNANVIGAMSGDAGSALRLIGEQLAQQGKTDVLDRIKEIGGAAADGILAGAEGIKVDANVEAGNVNTDKLNNDVNEAVQNATEGTQNTADVKQDANVEAGNVNTDGLGNGVDEAIQNATEQGGSKTVTVDTTVQANVNADSAKTSVFDKVRNMFGGLSATQSVNVNVDANTNPAVTKVSGLNQHLVTVPVTANVTAAEQQINGLSRTVEVTVHYTATGDVPKESASGARYFSGGLTYLNDQRGIADPREVVEYGGKRWWYEGRDVLANIPKGARIYTAAESRDFIDGSHRNGLTRVPFDGYIAELHAGEQVLTADEAEEYEGNNVISLIRRLRDVQSRDNNRDSGGRGDDGNDRFVYAPNINITGNADDENVSAVLRRTYKDFCDYMERYERDKRRKSFAS